MMILLITCGESVCIEEPKTKHRGLLEVLKFLKNVIFHDRCYERIVKSQFIIPNILGDSSYIFVSHQTTMEGSRKLKTVTVS